MIRFILPQARPFVTPFRAKGCPAPGGDPLTVHPFCGKLYKERNIVIKPSEDKPSEDKPSEDKPSEDKPSEDKPSEDKPSEDKPSEDNFRALEGTSREMLHLLRA